MLIVALCLLLAAARPAAALDDAPGESWVSRWLQQPAMTGDWFGLRGRLGEWGITPEVAYAANLQANPVGGRRRGQAYAGEIYVGVNVDFDTLAGLKGLTGSVSGDWAAGTNLSNDIGNFFTVAEYYEGNQLRLYTLFLRQTLLDGRLDLKAGRFATGDDFLTTPVGVSLVNAALNPVLLAVEANVPGVTQYPNATWGGRVRVKPVEAVSLSAGAFYSDPFLNQLEANGTEFGISGRAGYFVIGEATVRLHHDEGATGLPGRFRFGGYYDSNLYTSFADPQRQERGNYGFFALGEQMVFREGGPGTDQGLSLFWAFIYAPLQRINTLPYFGSAGATYRGLVPGRDKDTAAVAVYYGGFSRDLPGQTYEVVLEATYAMALTPWLTVQPDIQYVVNPNGQSNIKNALVIGAQIAIAF